MRTTGGPRAGRRAGVLAAHGLLLGGLWAASVQAREVSPGMRPGQLDLRAGGGLSLFAPSVEAGATLEGGVLALGPGTLSVGAQLDLQQCLLACSLPGLLAAQQVTLQDVYALGRLGYHVRLEGRSRGPVDLYGVLLGGVVRARTVRVTPDYHLEGRGRAPAMGVGLGGNYFLSERFFVGGEARLRFATGTYELSLTQGSYAFTPEDRHWLRLAPSTVLFAGVRLF